MNKKISIKQFFLAIYDLPSDKPLIRPDVWYKTQKEHWLGWLGEYNFAGAYGRDVSKKRDAKFAYNHIVNYQMLLWIIQAAGVKKSLVKLAKSACDQVTTMHQKSAAIRKHVPWEELVIVLWVNK